MEGPRVAFGNVRALPQFFLRALASQGLKCSHARSFLASLKTPVVSYLIYYQGHDKQFWDLILKAGIISNILPSFSSREFIELEIHLFKDLFGREQISACIKSWQKEKKCASLDKRNLKSHGVASQKQKPFLYVISDIFSCLF